MNDSIVNASTEVHKDVSISDRLAGLNLSEDDGLTEKSTNSSININNNNHNHNRQQDERTQDSRPDDDNEKEGVILAEKSATNCTKGDSDVKTDFPHVQSTGKEKINDILDIKRDENVCNAEPSTSISNLQCSDSSKATLAGEISDDSECSIEEEETSNSAADDDGESHDDNLASNELVDEEMSIGDQDGDEDVEEEEEFHEVEEDKLRTSQESVGSVGNKNVSPTSPDKQGSKAAEINPDDNAPIDTASDESKSKPDSTCETKTNENSNLPREDEGEVDAEPTSQPCAKPEAQLAEAPATTTTTSDTSDRPQSTSTKCSDWADIMLSTKLDDSQADDATIGEENAKSKDPEKKELDLDEDVKNPQYIPKKGVFYEHDDRSHDADGKKQSSSSVKKDDEPVELKESDSSKKSSSQEKQSETRRNNRKQRTESDRWNHDLFRDEKQKPKSKNELISAYGYDIRQERAPRNQAENRSERTNTGVNNAADKLPSHHQGSSDNPRARQRDNRSTRQNQPTNRSKDRRPRRQNNRNRADTAGAPPKRDPPVGSRQVRQDSKDVLKPEVSDMKHSAHSNSQPLFATPPARRDQVDGFRDRSARNDSRGRKQDSKDRPPDGFLPPITTIIPPMTTWSNKIEDMVKEEAASRKESPSRQQQHSQGMSNSAKLRSNDFWPQGNSNKGAYTDRTVRNMDDSRHHQHPRRYQDRDENHRPTQFMNRNHYNERSNQHQDWRRTNQYNSHVKSGEFEPIKTQTFENSRLSQMNINRSNIRDAREIINERRMQNQQGLQSKVPLTSNNTEQQQQQTPHPLSQHQHPSMPQQLSMQQRQPHQTTQQSNQQSRVAPHPQSVHHSQLLMNSHSQQPSGALMMRHQPPQLQQQHATSSVRLQQQQQQQQQSLEQTSAQTPQQQQSQQQQQSAPQQMTSQARHHSQQTSQQHQGQPRQGMVMNSVADGHLDGIRLNATSATTSDLINSRPIIKTDAYNGSGVSTHSHPQQQATLQQQHSQNHRSIAGGSMSQQGPTSTGSHLVPSHLTAAGSQASYYSPSNNSRDPAALAPAYGYIPSSHSVIDTARFMASQQLSDHGYMTSPGQTADVAAASVLHQQGLYTDAAAAGGTVASSAYMASQAGSTLSPSANIPVTGAGPPLAPMTYPLHSQYAPPPPYSNLYSQPQHNQAPPPQSSGPHYPFWNPYHL